MDEVTTPILHVDMDAFFVSVEVLDAPELAGKPVVVGGEGQRGVVASCSYEARAFGVRSAMPSVKARQLCPQAIFIGGHYSRYEEVSSRFHEVLRSMTPLVESIGLDEAFLDVSGAARRLGAPREIAGGIRTEVRDLLFLDCSVGVGRSKVIAKLASRAAKPLATRQGKKPGPGVVVIAPGEESAFLGPMAVEALWGVGPATTKRLHDLGVRTVGELAALPEETVIRQLGKSHGAHLAALSRGEDEDPVIPDRPAKSIGHEETFAEDLSDMEVLERYALRFTESVAVRLREAGLQSRTVAVKIKYADFSMVTRAHTFRMPVDNSPALYSAVLRLLRSIDSGPGVRLLGVSVSGLATREASRQMAFDFEGPEDAGDIQNDWEGVTTAIDAVRRRFGRAAVGTGGMVGRDGIVVPTRREAPWGPEPH